MVGEREPSSLDAMVASMRADRERVDEIGKIASQPTPNAFSRIGEVLRRVFRGFRAGRV